MLVPGLGFYQPQTGGGSITVFEGLSVQVIPDVCFVSITEHTTSVAVAETGDNTSIQILGG